MEGDGGRFSGNGQKWGFYAQMVQQRLRNTCKYDGRAGLKCNVYNNRLKAPTPVNCQLVVIEDRDYARIMAAPTCVSSERLYMMVPGGPTTALPPSLATH